MSNKALRGSNVNIEGGSVRVAAYGDDVESKAVVQLAVYTSGLKVYMYLTEYEAAKFSQELFESVKAIAESRTVSPAPTLEAVEA